MVQWKRLLEQQLRKSNTITFGVEKTGAVALAQLGLMASWQSGR